MPVVHLLPEQDRETPQTGIYRCPVYKVSHACTGRIMKKCCSKIDLFARTGKTQKKYRKCRHEPMSTCTAASNLPVIFLRRSQIYRKSRQSIYAATPGA